MKNIRIVHLFPKLLSLYGEYGNVSIMKKYLENNEYSVTVDEYENIESGIFENADFVYIGSGTEDNLIEACERLVPYSEDVKKSVLSSVWLATGNAMTLFGKNIERFGKLTPAVNAFEYETKIDDVKRFSGDVLSDKNNIFNTEFVGYINTSSIYNGIEGGLLKLLLNGKLGNDKTSENDGFIINNFIGTQLIGPFLVKNPVALQDIYFRITGEKLILSEESYIVKAYKTALSELKHRVSQA